MLRLPAHILEATLCTLSICGKGQCECVVYWTAPVGNYEGCNGWDHPTHCRSPYGYQIDDRWLTEYWFRLGREKRSIRAQVHTHPAAAFHSATDDQWPVISQAGFISIVIPNFAIGSTDLDRAWAGYLTPSGRWRHAAFSEILKVVP